VWLPQKILADPVKLIQGRDDCKSLHAPDFLSR
jgi:hypothetical protein